uniref:Uncharacterized protein n=1 Tax=Rhizophora mucronata TaxID=61149 RepID=A0A2P2Q1U5_RHIMU
MTTCSVSSLEHSRTDGLAASRASTFIFRSKGIRDDSFLKQA